MGHRHGFQQPSVHYLATFEEHNTDNRTTDYPFRDLLALTRSSTGRQQRHAPEQLSEEELTVFALTNPGPDLTPGSAEGGHAG